VHSILQKSAFCYIKNAKFLLKSAKNGIDYLTSFLIGSILIDIKPLENKKWMAARTKQLNSDLR